MKKFIIALTVAPLLLGTASVAADKKASKEGASAGAQSAEVGRGGLAEWPVSKEEANWRDAAPASTGSSSGTSGSDQDQKNR
jgi:hypothetical protein